MNAIRIFKKYEFGNENSGYYKWITEKVIITKDELFSYELAMPIWNNMKNIIIGVKENSGYQIWNMNVIASDIIEMRICGDCIIYFENYNDKQFEIICNILKAKIIELGVSKENINY